MAASLEMAFSNDIILKQSLYSHALQYIPGDPIDNESALVQVMTWYWTGDKPLTLKHWETYGCVVSTVATDALVLKHQAISIHNVDYTFIVLDQFHIKLLHIRWTASENEITFWKKMTQSFKG